MDYILKDIDINLWAQAKQKATIERKSIREVLLEGLKWYVAPEELPATPQKKKGEKRVKKAKTKYASLLKQV